MDPLRKAAIVLDHLERLEPSQAEAMLRQVGPEMAQRLRGAVSRLGAISPLERDQAVGEFMRRGASHGRTVVAIDDGVELETSDAIHHPPAPAYVASRPAEAGGHGRFAFLTTVSPEFLFPLLARESPQVSAVVVAHLSPVAAASLLGRMTPERQADVLRRVATLDELQPEILGEIEKHLEAICFEQRRQKERRQAGAAAVNAILQAAPDNQRTILSGTLARLGVEVGERSRPSGQADEPTTREPARRALDPLRGEELAETTPAALPARAPARIPLSTPGVRSSPLVSLPRVAPAPAKPVGPPPIPVQFEEFSAFDEATLAAIFHQAPPRTVLLALAGAPRSLVVKILATLPEEEAQRLDRQIESLGPLRLRDIDAAQQSIAQLAGELAARRRIRLPMKSSQLAAEV